MPVEKIIQFKKIHHLDIIGIDCNTNNNYLMDVENYIDKSIYPADNQEHRKSNKKNSQVNVIYRLKEIPDKPISVNYLLILEEVDKLLSSKPLQFDIFCLKDYTNYIDVIKQLKRLNRRIIGIEIKIKDIRNSIYANDIGRWIRCIKEVYKFCELTNNQLIISSGANCKFEMIGENSFEAILKVCDIEPQKYWKALNGWLFLK
ncbi:MAG TPA: hypothetical protein VFP25_02280, partial [Nitrososphaeraceae archaeon]|nr:hypothetical protein [Nitrososphaeraceae archaeon]